MGLDAQYGQLVTKSWPDRWLLDPLGIDAPLIQAPMANAQDEALAIGAIEGGALGSLPCAMLRAEAIRDQVAKIRAAVGGPINLNFFCHDEPGAFDDRQWREALAPYRTEFGVTAPAALPLARRPFDIEMCELVEELRPEVVSFHFGLPATPLLDRVGAAGCMIFATATSVAEARWLAERGVSAIIAQGWEAGGHAGRFLPADPSSHMGLIALVPQVVDAVDRPVIAAGGIGDARGIAAALMLGASAVQLGTAFLACPESRISALHRALLASEAAEATVSTNVFTGRHARGLQTRLTRELGPTSGIVPPFPHGGDALAELQRADPGAFASKWAGQGARLARCEPAAMLARRLAAETLELIA
ncbi:MAG TPA: nitronate monooxygenase [Sphingomonas sp.]|nr:nitronate monooxygenase [Sphingomonas sp.]